MDACKGRKKRLTGASWPFSIGLILTLLVCLGGAVEQESEDYIVICPIDEMVDQGLVVIVQRAVQEAKDAKAIIFEVDTFGGLVDSAVEIADTILTAPCPTIAYVRGRGAISAGALITMACNHIVMAPGTNIGAAEPVYGTPQGALPTGEKEVSFLRSKMAALAEVNGHNPAIAQAMVDKDIELYAARSADGVVQVWSTTSGNAAAPNSMNALGAAAQETIESLERKTGVPMEPLKEVVRDLTQQATAGTPIGEPERTPQQPFIGTDPVLISARGKLLTLTAQEAQTYGLIRSICSSLEQVTGLFGLEHARKVYIEMTLGERVFRWLTNPFISSVLLMVALAGLYLEVKTPGFGLPGIVSIIAFSLFFGARAVLGLADWIDIALVIVGMGLLLVEIFVLPGFGIAGVSGIICIILGIILSFTLKGFSLPEYEWDFARLREAIMALSMSLVLFIAFVVFIWKVFPHTPAYSRLVLVAEQQPEAGYVVQRAGDREYIGQRGTALTVLRPAGKGRFGNKTLQVVSRAEYLEEGTEIQIVEVEGNRYVVEPVFKAETDDKVNHT